MNKKDEIIFNYFYDYKNIINMAGTYPKIDLFIAEAKKAIENKEYSNVNIQDKDGNTFLHLAMKKNVELEIILNLIRDGADVSIKNNNGKNCFQLGKDYFKIVTKQGFIRELFFDWSNKDKDFYKKFKNFHKNTIKFFITNNKEVYSGNSVRSFLDKVINLKITDSRFISYNIAKIFNDINDNSDRDVINWFNINIEKGDFKDDFLSFFNGLMNQRLTFPIMFFGEIDKKLLEKINNELNQEDVSINKQENTDIVKEYLGRFIGFYNKNKMSKINLEPNGKINLLIGGLINYVLSNSSSFNVLEKDLSNSVCLKEIYLSKKLDRELNLNVNNNTNKNIKI